METQKFSTQLNFEDVRLPPHDRFPYNSKIYHVKQQVYPDLLYSHHPLIITGYTSLGKLLDFFAESQSESLPPETIRVLLGHEPFPTQREDFSLKRKVNFQKEFEDYWLDRGISLYKNTQILLAIDLLKRGGVQARIAEDSYPLHAKIYKGDTAITLGSSNFSQLGLFLQTEANVRFTATPGSVTPKRNKHSVESDIAHQAEVQRFHEACQFAEFLWDHGHDYTAQLLALLERLLRVVTWQEALARACAEILEGIWTRKYIDEHPVHEGPSLWPSQQQGIAQAMWIIEHVGSVLVADATGSGKTKMGAHLMRAVTDRIWNRGGMRRRDLPVLIGPASVIGAWKRAADDCGHSINVYSDGMLSSSHSENHEDLERAIRRAQVLAVDEAHRYHNRQSERSRHLYNNMADHVLLFTATPVNRDLSDLIAIIDLLGADNFDEEVLTIFDRLVRKDRSRIDREMSTGELATLRQAIQQFTVRRTKKMLNTMIEALPDQYRDIRGHPCRYPLQKARYYKCGETVEDCRLAEVIREEAKALRGLFMLRSPFQISAAQVREGIAEEDYLEWRLKGAKSLAVYNIMANLRSSRAALVEHLAGTETACRLFGIPIEGKSTPTGNIIDTLQQSVDHPPKNYLHIALPSWLADTDEYHQAIADEVAIYQHILTLVQEMSDSRERTKMQHLIRLQKEHGMLLAFDSTVITLVELKHRLEQQTLGVPVELAIGNESQGRKRVQALTRLGSQATQMIALCSDAMSEGINLQGASVVVHLDMPTVIRVAEQRVGRIDRMDSPHRVIVSYWPEESAAFALRSDERFFQRHQFVADCLGTNLSLPSSDKAKTITSQELVQEIQAAEEAKVTSEEWSIISDAFEPVRQLIDGPQRLLRDSRLYETFRTKKARVLSSVSSVYADHPWAFFAIAGTEWGAPRWVLLDRPGSFPVVDLAGICLLLRSLLGDERVKDRAFDHETAKWLKQFLDQLNKNERQLLPTKKRRALDEMEVVLKKYHAQAKQQADKEREEITNDLLNLLKQTNDELSVDWSTLAECWLEMIRPLWYDHLKNRRRSGPLRLRDIRQELIEKPLTTARLREVTESQLLTRPLDERIVSAIIGVPSTDEPVPHMGETSNQKTTG